MCAYVSLGPCVQFRRENPEASCDENGDFGPMQCMPQRGGRFRCYCSQPDGTEVPGTSVIVDRFQDAPNCDAIGKINSRDVTFKLQHYTIPFLLQCLNVASMRLMASYSVLFIRNCLSCQSLITIAVFVCAWMVNRHSARAFPVVTSSDPDPGPVSLKA